MPFQITETNHDSKSYIVLNAHIVGEISWEIYDAEMIRLAKQVETYQQPVYVILTAETPMPSGNAFKHFVETFNQFRSLKHFRLMISVYPEAVLTLRLIIGALARIYGKSWQNRFPAVQTREEANELIEADYKSLYG